MEMERNRRLDAETARGVEAVVVGFFVALDRFDDARALDLVADDVEWIRPTGTVQGRDAVRRTLEARPRARVTRHLVSNVELEPDGADAVTASFDVLVFDRAFEAAPTLPAIVSGPSLVLSSEDRLVRQDGLWRIARKRSQVVFKVQG